MFMTVTPTINILIGIEYRLLPFRYCMSRSNRDTENLGKIEYALVHFRIDKS